MTDKPLTVEDIKHIRFRLGSYLLSSRSANDDLATLCAAARASVEQRTQIEHLTSDGDEQIVALRKEVDSLRRLRELDAEEYGEDRAEVERLTKMNEMINGVNGLALAYETTVRSLRVEIERLREAQSEAYNQGRTDEARATLQSKGE
jgi:hypothetical protein